ncbi:MAG: hypothetical protein JOY71_11365 [Acetobacteraceae bacterium]|nr:hypothetical protein [Acetobacteraceae bacterium]MBV8522701.1 hypothetical protein [Acetobacteraceae bacterium]
MTGASILDPHLAKLFGAGGFIGRDAGAEVDARRRDGGVFKASYAVAGGLGPRFWSIW